MIGIGFLGITTGVLVSGTGEGDKSQLFRCLKGLRLGEVDTHGVGRGGDGFYLPVWGGINGVRL